MSNNVKIEQYVTKMVANIQGKTKLNQNIKGGGEIKATE